MLNRRTNYDKFPRVPVSMDAAECSAGWQDILARLRSAIRPGRFVICVECYPGAFVSDIADALAEGLRPVLTIATESCFRAAAELERILAPQLTDDPVFGRMLEFQLESFLDPGKAASSSREIERASGLVIVIGPAASLICRGWDLLVYCDMARWEIQQRQRRNQIGNIGVANAGASPASKYKQSFFIDWRAADRRKCEIFDRIDFLLDTNDPRRPKMIPGPTFLHLLDLAIRTPFRVVPFFDPGPWGGEWMRRNFDLPADAPNYAWCFDCVPEENSVLFRFGAESIELPAMNLVLRKPKELLGEDIHSRFGAEFPIRFDMLDTMGGGNLSLQVHPRTEYIRELFGMPYTQDESYYLLDAEADAVVYLGLKEEIDPATMARDLERAQAGTAPFSADRYVTSWPARKHDHFLIPAGTIHCSGRNSMVLEISATPYIFTFKLWDWNRLGLDGKPRPIHLDHGIRNIDWSRTTSWVKRELVSPIERVSEGEGWREERTGLHSLEFIETRRHWFTKSVTHDTRGTVNVLNLVEGDAAVIESPSGAFAPFALHYAETVIVPAAIGTYTIRPAGEVESPLATMKAFVRKPK